MLTHMPWNKEVFCILYKFYFTVFDRDAAKEDIQAYHLDM